MPLNDRVGGLEKQGLAQSRDPETLLTVGTARVTIIAEMNVGCREICAGLVRLFFTGVACLSAQAGDFASEWKTVKEALRDGDHPAALRTLAVIEKEAVARQVWDQATQAAVERIDLDARVKEAGPDAGLAELRQAAAAMPDPMKPVLEVLLAHRYWSFSHEQSARLGSRPQPGGGQRGVGVWEWDQARLFSEIERCYQRALAFEPVLKKIPAELYGALLESGTASDACRPTLYDAIVYDLLSFYAAAGRSGAEGDDDVVLAADGPAFDDVAGFSFIIPETAARRSRVLRALRRFQELLVFHEKDPDPSAYAEADLARLQFCRKFVAGDGVDERYAAALDRFAHTWRTHEVASRATALRARNALDQGDAAFARMLAQDGAAAFPKSVGAAQCRNLIAEVETPAVRLSAERMWCPPWPAFDIVYKNLSQLHFRVVPVAFAEMFAARPRSAAEETAFAAVLLGRRSVKSWSMPLPPASDYRERTYHATVPKGLPPGLYAVFASPDGRFDEGGGPVSWGVFRVSGVALVVDPRPDRVCGYVLSAREGEPIAGARVESWRLNRQGGYQREQTVLTGEDGGFAVLGDQAGERLLYAEKNREAAHTWSPVWKGNARERNEGPLPHVTVFMDRTVYRLGQTIQYKGINWVADRQSDHYYTVAGSRLSVYLKNPAGERVAEQSAICNAYGSFSGSFLLPSEGDTGRMVLCVEGLGESVFDVEPRERPGFEVALDPPTQGARLAAVVSVNGRAASWSGVPAGGARVAWRVTRAMRTVSRRDQRGTDADAVEIAKGSTRCDDNGAFGVSFFAKPDVKVPDEDGPLFVFAVTAEVTGADGEKGSGETHVALGVAEWCAAVECGAWQTTEQPVRLCVRVQTLGGEPVAAAGDLKIFAVKQPAHVTRPRLAGDGADERLAETQSEPESWPDDGLLTSERITIGAGGSATGSVPLKVGMYRVRFETRDPAGKAVHAQRLVRVIDPVAGHLSFSEPSYFDAASWCVGPGGTFRAAWGSGYERATALVLVEQDGLELLRRRTESGVTQQVIELPVTESMRGGVWVRTLCVKENRGYSECRRLDVPWHGKRLQVALLDPSPCLTSEGQVTWRVEVKGPDGTPASAEIVAALYDRSLGGVASDDWRGAFDGVFGGCDTNRAFLFQNGRVGFSHLFGEWKRTAETAEWRYRTWLGGDVFADQAGGVLSKALAAAVPDRSGGPDLPKTGRAFSGAVSFLPHVVSDQKGQALLTFALPAALTEWRLLLFAHDQELRSGSLEADGLAGSHRSSPDPY